VARVLVVEDDPDIRMLLDVRLRQMGHLVLAAESAEQALDLLAEKGPPELAVLDVLMPGTSGLELLTQLRADPVHAALPAIFLSGRVEQDDIAAGRALGATYLTKPVVMNALGAAIERALRPEPTAAGAW